MAELTLAMAQNMVAGALDKAEQIGVCVSIAVVDAGAHLKTFGHMDGAILGSVDVAQRKARTAVLFPGDTGEFGRLVAAEGLLGIELSNGGITGFPGGLPVYADGRLLGAVGVSGASAEQDREIARHAAGAL